MVAGLAMLVLAFAGMLMVALTPSREAEVSREVEVEPATEESSAGVSPGV